MDTKERVALIIERNILTRQTMLVPRMLNEWIPQTENRSGWEDVVNLYDDSLEVVEEFLSYCEDIITDDWHELPFDEREILAEEHGFVPEEKEIYEWWLVSTWLAEKLIDIDEPVLQSEYGNWWGRTVTGQAIELDGTIQKIIVRLNDN